MKQNPFTGAWERKNPKVNKETTAPSEKKEPALKKGAEKSPAAPKKQRK